MKKRMLIGHYTASDLQRAFRAALARQAERARLRRIGANMDVKPDGVAVPL